MIDVAARRAASLWTRTLSSSDLSLSQFLSSLDLAAGTRSILVVEAIAEQCGDFDPRIPFGHFPPVVVFELDKPRRAVVVGRDVADDARNDSNLLTPFPAG
eukprot:CAMPEP_0168281056 /NCGR_PEP_ID=MMETSP0141_2-20121125/21497_1 /TAXON_ID=44445 /ORGANISM="Pseudo-nitzschia australis, Strain 10249 10 AB" /LENGTH=100 /DNA_ID=CAMNT_0008224423 /DNA_START=302 /DNA_END=604 /DNA_ORIENTATION=-